MEIILYIIGGGVAIFFIFSALSWGFMDTGRSIMSITVLILASILVFNFERSLSVKEYLIIAGVILVIFYNIRDMGIIAILALLYLNYQVLSMDHVSTPVVDNEKKTEYRLPATQNEVTPATHNTTTPQSETPSGNEESENKELFGDTGELEESEEDPFLFDNQYYLVNTSVLNVREKPRAGSRKVTSLTKNEKVKVIKESGTWVYIENTGWVSKRFLKAL